MPCQGKNIKLNSLHFLAVFFTLTKYFAITLSTWHPNHAVQADAAGAARTWARFTRQTAVGYDRYPVARIPPAAPRRREGYGDPSGAASQFAGACLSRGQCRFTRPPAAQLTAIRWVAAHLHHYASFFTPAKGTIAV
jgi:hypothetical protein